MYSYGPPHMAVQKQDDQQEHTFSSYVRIRDVVLKTYLGRWTIGRSGERGSGISVLPARWWWWWWLKLNSKFKIKIFINYSGTKNIFQIINILQDTFQNNSVLNFTHELNKNNKISFLDVLIDTNYNNNFTTSTYKKNSYNNSFTLNFKSECPFRYKKAKINNLISRAKLISSSKTIFYKEVENIKQALINNEFPNYIVDVQIECMIKNVNQQNKHCTTPPSQQTYIKLFYCNQMHYNYKSDEKILKTLIHRNILPTDPNKKIKLIIYYNKFKTSNLVIKNNSSSSLNVL